MGGREIFGDMLVIPPLLRVNSEPHCLEKFRRLKPPPFIKAPGYPIFPHKFQRLIHQI